MFSNMLGQRVRGLVAFSNNPLPTRLMDGEVPLLQLIGGIV